ncbi:hypothetical protein KEM60_01971 [Austwickia sp. TVS 96-490-7B]|uniref:transglutaminase domain-containing protein n=1 Tax=Austwickia sp. TVS 96-490-7B TaxID=2830843 RepID=UPI001C58F886|nr:transglutaminase domain-containing protein [Austwickia sp. TVS 96-490-7B]MBW3085763.1 hypothetical protein [Austwickia sp. TVS 96-490-7B]
MTTDSSGVGDLGDTTEEPVTTHDRSGWVDAAGAVVLSWCVGIGWWGTYDGWLPLAGWMVAVLLGVVIEAVALRVSAARLVRWLVRIVGIPVVFLGAAPLIGGRASHHGPVGMAAWQDAGTTAIRGWRDLLTTLPPLRSDDPVAVLPALVGLLVAWTLFAVSRASERSEAVVAIVVGATAVVAFLGTVSTPGSVLRGVAIAAGLTAWVGARRARLVARNRHPGWTPVVVGSVLLGCAAGVAAPVAHAMDGQGGARTTLRERITPPVSDHEGASVLAGFRRFRPAGKALADETLVTVSGLPDQVPVRLTVLDCYSGTVWAACGTSGAHRPGAGSFWKVGSTVPTQVTGTEAQYRMRISPAYADDPYLKGWVPSAGALTSLSFEGERRDEAMSRTRVNVGTGAVVVSGGLRAGDEVVASARVPSPHTPDQLPMVGGPYVDGQQLQAVSAYVARWGGSSSDPWQRLLAATSHLKDTGAYSDGDTGAERPVLPGHGVGRVEALLGSPEPAGDDEQFAAAAALMANSLGLPARVVVGGVPDSAGTLRGRDVRAWVEVAGKDRWVELSADRIVPPRDKRPQPVPKQEKEGSSAAVVPPPNTSRRPSSEDPFAYDAGQGGSDRWSSPLERFWWNIPVWARIVIGATAGPPLVWLLLVAAIAGVKSVRRVRRRRRTPVAAIESGWEEVVDRLVDAGLPRQIGVSRGETVQASGRASLASLAAAADAAQFGPGGATAEQARAFWRDVAVARLAVMREIPWWRRLIVVGSLRSLIPFGRSGAAYAPSDRHRQAVAGSESPLATPEVAVLPST